MYWPIRFHNPTTQPTQHGRERIVTSCHTAWMTSSGLIYDEQYALDAGRTFIRRQRFSTPPRLQSRRGVLEIVEQGR